jgi:mRNA-degrading endonuclease RelE of RelBE toxin-antitoxin system
MPIDDELGVAAPDVLARLEAFARGDEKQSVLPWAERLSPADRERLRGDLAVVLEEPALTGEPVDWREIGDILRFYPTASQLLPRGRLKKMKNRDLWQLHLPDGYRLRYVVDKPARTVTIVYLGPHPDRAPAAARTPRGSSGSAFATRRGDYD